MSVIGGPSKDSKFDETLQSREGETSVYLDALTGLSDLESSDNEQETTQVYAGDFNIVSIKEPKKQSLKHETGYQTLATSSIQQEKHLR